MSRLTWDDLLIREITPEQFERWLVPWTGVVVGRVAPAFMSKFGFWFLRRPEGHVEMLDVFTGGVERVAESYELFMRDVNEQWWQERYLLSELVFQLHQAGKISGPGQCYALAPPPALGGPNPTNGQQVDPRFVMVMDIPVWQSLCAQFFRAVAACPQDSRPRIGVSSALAARTGSKYSRRDAILPPAARRNSTYSWR